MGLWLHHVSVSSGASIRTRRNHSVGFHCLSLPDFDRNICDLKILQGHKKVEGKRQGEAAGLSQLSAREQSRGWGAGAALTARTSSPAQAPKELCTGSSSALVRQVLWDGSEKCLPLSRTQRCGQSGEARARAPQSTDRVTVTCTPSLGLVAVSVAELLSRQPASRTERHVFLCPGHGPLEEELTLPRDAGRKEVSPLPTG